MSQTQNRPQIVDSNNRDYHDTGVPSTVAIAKHPLHPMLVTIPIAFLVAAPLTDIGYWLTTDSFWARASVWLVGAGLITGILAALTGMLDFMKIGRVRKHTAGWVHMYANVIALVVTAINFGLRLVNPTANVLYTGLILSVIVATLLGISGWYGGELVYRHKIAVIGDGEAEQA